MILIGCDRIGCEARADIDQESSWEPGSGFPFAVEVELPDGWRVDRVEFDSVIHCPEHAAGNP